VPEPVCVLGVEPPPELPVVGDPVLGVVWPVLDPVLLDGLGPIVVGAGGALWTGVVEVLTGRAG
jgi:hypothetical protein